MNDELKAVIWESLDNAMANGYDEHVTGHTDAFLAAEMIECCGIPDALDTDDPQEAAQEIALLVAEWRKARVLH